MKMRVIKFSRHNYFINEFGFHGYHGKINKDDVLPVIKSVFFFLIFTKIWRAQSLFLWHSNLLGTISLTLILRLLSFLIF